MSRKYRQHGYQDEEPRNPPGGTRPARQDRSEGPRGRGLGAPSATVFRCRVCSGRIDLEGGVAVEASCPGCGADLHTCSHCAHFDAAATFECRVAIDTRIAAKAKRNRCDHFEVRWTSEFQAEAPSRSDAAKAFDDLFDF